MTHPTTDLHSGSNPLKLAVCPRHTPNQSDRRIGLPWDDSLSTAKRECVELAPQQLGPVPAGSDRRVADTVVLPPYRQELVLLSGDPGQAEKTSDMPIRRFPRVVPPLDEITY